MSRKDPKRWQETIIRSPFASLTKRDVFDYYDDPKVKTKILDAVRATGAHETILRQSFNPKRAIIRRKDHEGKLIDLRKPGKYDFWNDIRMTEVHPTFGKKTNTLLADIDPGKKVPWETTKAIAETIAKTMKDAPDVKSVQVQFSGDDGFYVRGILDKAINVNKARAQVRKLLHGIAQRPDVTFSKAKAKQIRIDTTPLKYRGSVKAPFSLSSQTGLVSAPVSLKKLPKVQKSDFTIDKIKVGASKKKTDEFAPGIPAARTIDPIPSVRNRAWDLAIQLHEARRAGKHFDLRLVDPKTNKAHSFAVPKARLPTLRDRMLLAVQQPTHTADYALNFEGTIPEGTYGAGKVTLPIREKVQIIKSNANRIQFERQDGDRFTLFRTKGLHWGLRKNKR